VFIDFNQMARDRTIACAYSLRANARATASTPLRWEELGSVEPDDFDLRTVPARLAEHGDAHAGIDDTAHDISELLEWSARDAANGEGDMPYPPEYPKMEGEPMRVQPSRAKKA
jgi:DNA primase